MTDDGRMSDPSLVFVVFCHKMKWSVVNLYLPVCQRSVRSVHPHGLK